MEGTISNLPLAGEKTSHQIAVPLSSSSSASLYMDPITGIGLAASVVQLVQFSIVAAQTCQQIYRDGSTKEHLDTGDIASQLADLTGSLRQSLVQQGPQLPVLSKEEKQLLDIASKCEASASTLQCELQKLRTPPRASVLTVAFKAARSIQKKRSIKEIQEQLYKYRTMLETSLLYNLSERFKAQNLRNSERFTRLDDTLKNVIIRLADSQTSLAVLVQQESEHTRQQIAAQVANESLFGDVTQSLFFADMTTRQIQVAYEFDGIEDSYEWIFDEQSESRHEVDQEHDGDHTQPRWDSFSRWLRVGSSVYWINGKAGSGKSTLMNYICDHKKKEEYLRQWSAGKRLLTPAFFFWNAGSRQQKSIDGLLRSLVYQMLTECPGLIAYFANKSLHTWTEKRLLDILSILLTQSEIPLATCLFVDGLDEFEGHYDAVVETMIRLANEPNVKICLSSRPLLRFEKAFTTMPSLKLQDLTFKSIYTYAEKKLNPLIESRFFYREDDRVLSRRLLGEIVSRAEGVFLWAVIAIREVCDGLNDFVDLHDLARAIEDLPPEIESLYVKMLSRIKPVYRRGAARMLQTMIYYSTTTWETKLDLFGMYLIEKEEVSGDMPLMCNHVDIEDIARASQTLKSRAISHTRGLLDLIAINKTPESQTNHSLDEILLTEVQVSHRTVKDFLHNNPAARIFMTTAGIVEEHLRLSIARGLFAEMVYISRQNRALDPAIKAKWKAYELLRSAKRQLSIVERMTGAAQLKLIDSLHSHSLLPKGFPVYYHSAPYFLGDEHKPVVDLIGAAASSGMLRYICHVLGLPVEKNEHYHINLLDFQQVYSPEEATGSILEWDVAPNSKLDYSNSTLWLDESLKWRQHTHADVELKRQMDGITLTYLLQCCEVSVSDPNLLETLSLVRTLLQAGADPMVQFGSEDSLDKFPCPRYCFWSEWFSFLTDSEVTDGSYQLPVCEDPRVTVDHYFDTTKALIAHGADINYQLISPKSDWGFGLRRCNFDESELDFHISPSAMFWLEEYFLGYEEFREFAARARAQAPSKRPWRKLLSIFHHMSISHNRPRAHLDENETKLLWPLIEKWEESGHWRDSDALRLTMRQIFKAHCPDVKLDSDLYEDTDMEVDGEVDEGME